jgi:23S rRNA pseudouridine1911/1915/1917 synthase
MILKQVNLTSIDRCVMAVDNIDDIMPSDDAVAGNGYDADIEDADGGELYEHFRFVADKGQQLLRVDKFLVARLEKSSRNRVQQAADAGCILVNGRAVKSNYRVKPLDVVTVVMDRPRYELEIIAEDIPLDIVYEDEHLLVVNKPAGLVVHPGHGNYHGTLVNALAYHFKDNPEYDVNDPRMGLVHRIDKDTSGLLVVAKTPDAKTHLGRQFFNKTTKREYVAVVWGRPEPADGRIEGNIGRSLKDRLQMTVFPDGDYGKHAVTHYSTVEPLGYVSVVKCVLETGRTHQIRVHMKHIGHPLFNDVRYGGDAILRGLTTARYRQFVANCFDLCPRQALHARTLGFVHPATGEEMFFSAPVPPDMTALIDKWRNYNNAVDI